MRVRLFVEMMVINLQVTVYKLRASFGCAKRFVFELRRRLVELFRISARPIEEKENVFALYGNRQDGSPIDNSIAPNTSPPIYPTNTPPCEGPDALLDSSSLSLPAPLTCPYYWAHEF